jgi:hypothetical protein
MQTVAARQFSGWIEIQMLYSIQEAGVLQTSKTKVHLGLFSMCKILEQTHFITTID